LTNCSRESPSSRRLREHARFAWEDYITPADNVRRGLQPFAGAAQRRVKWVASPPGTAKTDATGLVASPNGFSKPVRDRFRLAA
jgi:hypothetical protein